MSPFVRKSLIAASLFAATAAVAAVKYGPVAMADIESVVLVPIITATKTGALQTDANGNGVVNPGDALRYTVTLNNTGPDPATGVMFDDTIDANTTFVPGSLVASPVAVNDAYSTIGNVGISVPDGASDLLANDFDANNPGAPALVFTLINAIGLKLVLSAFADHTVHLTEKRIAGVFAKLPLKIIQQNSTINTTKAAQRASKSINPDTLLKKLFFKNALFEVVTERL